MCGIVGYMTAEERAGALARDDFIEQALIMGTLRGDDSTGVFGVTAAAEEGDQPGWLKQLGPGYDFVNSKDYAEWNKYYFKYKVGHNRAATKGEVTADNAHPFQEGPVTLVHNGTLWTTYGLPKTQHQLGVDVDSHAICHNLALADCDSAGEVIEALDGAFALVWHDNRDDTLNFVRNDERPFHLAEVTGQKTIFFMSEAGMLDCVIGRMKSGNRIRKIVQPKPGQLLKFHAGDLFNPEIEELKVDRSWGNYGRSSWAGKQGGYLYDYDDDDFDVGAGGSRPKAPPAATPTNKVAVGGREREVPEKLQLELLDHDLQVEDRLPFCPTHFRVTIPGSQPRGILSGLHPVTGQTMVLYGVAEDLYNRSGERVWEVRPVGLKYLEKKSGETAHMIVCRLCSTVHREYLHSSARSSGFSYSEGEYDDEDSPFEGFFDSEAPDYVLGPGKIYIPRHEFIDCVSEGCISCRQHISLADAEKVIWMNGDRDPMCPECVEEWAYIEGQNRSWAE